MRWLPVSFPISTIIARGHIHSDMKHRHFLSLLSAFVLLPGSGNADEPTPAFSDAIPPSPSTRVPDEIQDDYWYGEFQRVNKAVAKAKDAQVVFFGDSITLMWSRLGAQGKEAWEKHFAKYHPINMGNSGDITPVMLYRTQNGNLDFPEGEDPRVAVLLCGTNNYVVTQSDGGKVKWELGMETPPREVADGIRAVAQSFRKKLPQTRLILLGILPVKNEKKWAKCLETNRILSAYHYPDGEVVFLDLKDHFLDGEGTLKAGLFTDGTHLTPAGYQVMARALAPRVEHLVKLGPLKLAK